MKIITLTSYKTCMFKQNKNVPKFQKFMNLNLYFIPFLYIIESLLKIMKLQYIAEIIIIKKTIFNFIKIII